MMIDLSTAHVGDKFHSRDGQTWTYIRGNNRDRYGHLLTNELGGKVYFAENGWADRSPPLDLIKAIENEPSE